MIDIPAVAAAASGTGYGLANFLGGLAARRQSVARVMLCSQTAALAIITTAASLLPSSPHTSDLLLGASGGLVTAVGARPSPNITRQRRRLASAAPCEYFAKDSDSLGQHPTLH
jgi:hypothetical protein